MRAMNISKGTLRFLKFGVPLVVFVIAGSLGLTEFTEIKVKKRDEKVKKLSMEEASKFESKRKKTPVSLDEVYQKMQEDLNIDEWENKRGPRPWEMNSNPLDENYDR